MIKDVAHNVTRIRIQLPMSALRILPLIFFMLVAAALCLPTTTGVWTDMMDCGLLVLGGEDDTAADDFVNDGHVPSFTHIIPGPAFDLRTGGRVLWQVRWRDHDERLVSRERRHRWLCRENC